jgi:hypothetical protein
MVLSPFIIIFQVPILLRTEHQELFQRLLITYDTEEQLLLRDGYGCHAAHVQHDLCNHGDNGPACRSLLVDFTSLTSEYTRMRRPALLSCMYVCMHGDAEILSLPTSFTAVICSL